MEKPSWNSASWRKKSIKQQPDWPDMVGLDKVCLQLAAFEPLVNHIEVSALREKLSLVCSGRGFLLQAGDCAESFHDFSVQTIQNKLKIILQMAVVLQYYAGLPVVKVGRMAGQFAKPRSDSMEVRGEIKLPAFRGHMVNEIDFTPGARAPDATRLLSAYNQSRATIQLLRGLTKGGLADLRKVHSWNQEFVSSSPEGKRYEILADEITRSLHFLNACGMDSDYDSVFREVDFFTSHEGLILEYEEGLVRPTVDGSGWYDSSAHMLWVGERTRDINDAHIEFFSGVENPVGCKIGPSVQPEEAIEICEKLNPEKIPGKLVLISRMGAGKVFDCLRPVVRSVESAGHPVVWVCDPMHGNTFSSSSGYKTRKFSDVADEVNEFFQVHKATKTWPGGLHIELTGENVTECIGGSSPVEETNLSEKYETMCDPRLNASQSLDLAFHVAEILKSLSGNAMGDG